MMLDLLNNHFSWHPYCLLKNCSFAGFLYYPIGLGLRDKSEVHQFVIFPETLVEWLELFYLTN